MIISASSSKFQILPGKAVPPRFFGSNIKSDFVPLNILLWIHGFGFTMKFRWTRRYFAHFAVSVLLLIICDLSILLKVILFIKFIFFKGKITKSAVTLSMTYCLEWILRVIIYSKRKKLYHLTKKMNKVSSSVLPPDNIDVKWPLSVVFIVNDLITITSILLYFITDNIRIYSYRESSFFTLPASFSTYFFYINITIQEWSAMSFVVPIYFCSFCYILKKMLQNLKKKIIHSRNADLNVLYNAYAEHYRLILSLDQTFRFILLFTFIITLYKLFYHLYLLFTGLISPTPYRLWSVMVTFTRFTLMCTFASSVTKSASELKDLLCDLSVPPEMRWVNVRFMIKMKETFVGFRLLDNIIIDRDLILSAIGTLLTYGIMIATFNLNSGKESDPTA